MNPQLLAFLQMIQQTPTNAGAQAVGGVMNSWLNQPTPANPFSGMMNTLNNFRGQFPGIMGGVNQAFANIANQNRIGASNALDREAKIAMANLDANTRRYLGDQQRAAAENQALYGGQSNIDVAGIQAGASQNNALANAMAQLGSSQYGAMGNYLAGMPAAQASMHNMPIQAGASQNIAGMQALAEVLGAAIPANLQYAMAPAQMGSAERIAATQAGAQSAGDLYNALANAYAARQGAGANMFGSQAAADASMHGSNQNALASMLESQLGLRGVQDTNATNRYLGDANFAGTMAGHQLGLQGVQDTNRSNVLMNQNTNRTNMGIAGLGAQADVLGSRLNLEGQRSAADANRFGSQQNALASMFQSGAGLQSTREQEAGRNSRFNTAAGLFSNLVPIFSRPPQFGGFRTNYGTGVTV